MSGDAVGWWFIGLMMGAVMGYLAGRFDKAWFKAKRDTSEPR